MAYNAGQALLQIVPSFKGVADAIDAEAEKWGASAGSAFADAFSAAAREGAKDAIPDEDAAATEKGSSAGGKFADAFRARVAAALRELPTGDVNLNDAEAEAKIAEIRAQLEELGNKRIGVDITDDEAIAKVEALKAELDELGAKSESIRVRVDTGAASAELAGFEAEVAGADAATAALGGEAEGAGAGLGAMGGDAEESGGAISVLIPALAALAAALIPIGGLAAGALASLPAILAGAGTGIGALKLGLGGIGNALTAYGQQQTAAAKATGGAAGAASNQASQAISNAASIRNAANSVASAEESLANAKQSATDSVRQANEQLISSENALADAEYNEQQAQEALTQARIDAQNALTNYNDQLADGALGIQQAQLDVQTAQAGIAAVGPGSGSTALQQQQAQLTYQQAVQRLKDLQDQQSQLQQTTDAANAAGVDGAQSVVQAQHQLLDANHAVTTAQQSQTDAQTSLSEAEVSAVQKVTDAQNALTNALLNQQDAMAQIAQQGASGGGGGSSGLASATNAFNAAMAKLTPQGREFVNFLIDLKGRVADLGNAVQAILVPGLQAGITDALPLFGPLSLYIENAAQGIGDLATNFGQFLGSAKGQSEINSILSQGAGFMKQMGDAAFTLFKAFLSVGSQAAPITKALGDGIQHIVDAFAKWAEGGGFQGFLAWLKANGPSIVSDISEIVKGFGKFVIAIEPLGKDILDLAGFLGKIVDIASPVIGFLADMAKWIFLLFNPIGQLIGLVDLFSTHWHQVWGDARQWLDDAYQHIKSAVFDPLVNFFTQTIPHTLDTVVGFFAALPGRLASAVGDLIGKVFASLALVGFWLETNVWGPISSFFSGLGTRIATAAVGMWDGIANAFIDAFNFLINAWDSLSFKLPGIDFGPIHLGGTTVSVPQIKDLSHIAGKAGGGPVDANTPYFVGEQGMELFTPAENGFITPTGATNALLASLSGGSNQPVGPLMAVGEQHIHQDVDVQAVGQTLSFLSKGRHL